MLRRLINIAVSASIASFASPAFSGSDDVNGFQGLQWGAKEEDVYDKYQGKIRKAICTSITEFSAKAFHHVCDHPVLDNYEVVGIPFSLSFYLTEDTRRLDGVALFYSGKIGTSDSQQWPRMLDEWSKKYRSLREALNEKYGELYVEVFSPAKNTGFAMADAIWKRGNTEISLTAKLSQGGRYTDPSQDFSIHYRPTPTGDAAKL